MNPSVVIVAVAVLLGGVLFWQLQQSPKAKLRRAEKAVKSANIPRARSLLEQVVGCVDDGKVEGCDVSDLAVRAHLALAEIDQEQGNRQQAVSHFRRAKRLGASLSQSAILLWAECAAEKGEIGEDDIDAYLSYLTSGARTGAAAEKVHSVLRDRCQVTEEMKPAQRRFATQVLRRVLAANANLEWAHYYLGLADVLDGRSGEALVAFKKALDLNPQRALTFYWLAVCQMHMPGSSLEGAMEMIERFLSFPHEGVRTRVREARVCSEIAKRLIESIGGFGVTPDDLQDGKRESLDKAIHYWEVAVARKPDHAANQFDLGCAYRLQGARENAITAFCQAATLEPNTELYAFELGRTYWSMGHAESAVGALERVLQINPASELAHDLLGEIFFSQECYEKAALHLNFALGSGQENSTRLALLVRALFAQSDYDRVAALLDDRKAAPAPMAGDESAGCAAGRAYSALGRFDDAIQWLKNAGEDEALYFLGCAHANLAQYPEASLCFDRVATKNSQWSVKAIVQRGHILRMTGDTEGAALAYRQALAAGSQLSDAFYALGSLLLAQGEFDQAVSCFSHALALKSDDHDSRLALARSYELKEEFPSALQHYSAIPKCAVWQEALLRIGVIQCRIGDHKAALITLDTLESHRIEQQRASASPVGPETKSDTLLFYRGLALALCGRCQDAIVEWERLLQRHPDNERLQVNLARANYVLGSQYLSQSKRTAAISHWETYLAQYPMDENVLHDLGELYFREAMDALHCGGDGLVRACECLRSAMQTDPQNEGYRFYAALCNLRAGKDVKASVESLCALVEERGRNPELLYHVGWALLQCGDTSKAATFLAEAHGHPEATCYRKYAAWALANLMIQQDRFAEAAEMLISNVAAASVGGGA